MKDQYTNADHIRSMTDEELCEWMMRARAESISALMCSDYGNACWYICKHNHFCEDEKYCTSEKIVMQWLKARVE